MNETVASKPVIAPLPLPLDIHCTDSDCDNGLHCFKASRKLRAAGQEGVCRSCGADLIDWSRVHGRRIDDARFTFECLRHELIRHFYWHVQIDGDATERAIRKGRAALIASIDRRLRTSVGSAEPFRDGMQTPKVGNVLYYAQHATASCCRTCINYWHGIPKGRDLYASEVEYLGQIMAMYIDDRMPDLPEEGTGRPRAVRRPRGDRQDG